MNPYNPLQPLPPVQHLQTDCPHLRTVHIDVNRPVLAKNLRGDDLQAFMRVPAEQCLDCGVIMPDRSA